jgi:hypothetical protein
MTSLEVEPPVHSRRLSMIVLPLVLCAASCEREPPPMADRRPTCRDTVEPMPDGGMAPAGSAEELLRRAQATYRAPFTWTRETRNIRHTAQGQQANLELVLQPTSAVRFLRSEHYVPPGEGPVPLIFMLCENRLEVDATMQLKSNDGLLNERGTVTLRMLPSGDTWLESKRKLPDLRGAFEIADNPTELRVDHLAFSFRLGANQALNGYVGGHYSGSDPSFGYLVRFACFPDQACR